MFLARQYDGVTVHPFGGGTTESVGTFFSADYMVTDQIMITGGVRYSKDDKDFTYRQDGLPTFGYIHFPPDNDGDFSPDCVDLDDDNDGYNDDVDAFDFDNNEWLDTDDDGIGNNADTDDDGDNLTDFYEQNSDPATDPLNPDTDGDGTIEVKINYL